MAIYHRFPRDTAFRLLLRVTSYHHLGIGDVDTRVYVVDRLHEAATAGGRRYRSGPHVTVLAYHPCRLSPGTDWSLFPDWLIQDELL